LTVRVLTSVFWPIDNQVAMCTLPQSAELAFRNFEQFYLGKHNGRKITLNPRHGQADVKAIFFPTGNPRMATQRELVADEDLASQQVPSLKSTVLVRNFTNQLIHSQESDMPGSSNQSAGPRRREEHKILTVSTYQMCLLMRFNIQAKMSFEASFTVPMESSQIIAFHFSNFSMEPRFPKRT